MTNIDDVRRRFGETAARYAEHTAEHVGEVSERLERYLNLRGDERALDVGTGAGTLAIALAPLVREVIGVDVVPELLEAARGLAPENVTFQEADATSLPFEAYWFDVVGTRRTLHHVARPELVMAEISRVAKLGAVVVVEDQVAPIDPLAALALDRFESARDPSHVRTLPDVDLRQLFEVNGLSLEQTHVEREVRPLEPYLDLAGCEGPSREVAKGLSPQGGEEYTVDAAFYVLRKLY